MKINQTYKINHIVDKKVVTIYLFNGSTNKDLNEYFSPEEIENIKNEDIKVIFSKQQIHSDDTIGTIKIKIANELKSKISIEEIYLYCQKIETLNAVSIYQSLTQNRKIELTNIRIEQFISNIVSNLDGEPFEKLESKDVYTYDDILEMKVDNKQFIVNKVLGQKFFIIENEYPFVCDPFDVSHYDAFFEKYSRRSLTTLNSHLLLNTGDILNNNIFLCLAQDVLTYADSHNFSQETTTKIYYPFLYEKDINTLEELQEEKYKLIESNKKILNSKTLEAFQTIDMFYDVYKLRKSELNYISKGIKYIKAIIKPDFFIKIPLEVIFKVIHATINNPLIKYNPSIKQENVYRLYTGDNISTDGRKIPYLKKATIFKLMKTIGKTKSVTVYVEHKENEKMYFLICEIDENGFITISSEFENIISEVEIDILFKVSINPIIHELQNLLLQSGYKLNEFHSLKDENVEISQITYETQIEIKKPFNITSFQGCISSVFNIELNSPTKGVQMRYKKVSNFNKVTSQEAFIIEKSNQGLRGMEIIEALLENFQEDLDRKGAEELLRKVANEIQTEKGIRKSDNKIKYNPGFKTLVKVEKSGIITISMENINNIYYLDTIPIYLDTIVRFTQNKTSTEYPVRLINKFCSSELKEDIVVPDIIPSQELSVLENEIPSLDEEDENEENYSNKNEYTNALDLFFGEDDFENFDEEDEHEGGNSDSSPESLSPFPEIDSPVESPIESPVQSSDSSFVESPKQLSPLPSPVESPKQLSPLESPVESKSSFVESPKSLSPFPEIDSPQVESPIESPVESSEASFVESPKQLSPLPSPVESPKQLSPLESPVESKSSFVESPKSLSPFPEIDSPQVESPIESPVESSEASFVESPKQLSPLPSPVESPPKQLSPFPSPVESPVESKSSLVESPKQLTPFPLPVESPLESPQEEENEEEQEPEEQEPESEEEQDEELEKEEPHKEEEEVNEVKDIDGLKLNKPYYFQTLIEEKDPILILKEDTREFNAYSRTCSSDTRRQPVILTDKQLAGINKEHPGFLKDDDVIKYGSNPKNQFNYICPRYWCLKTNTVIDPSELKEVVGKDGKKELVHPTCGKVIPRKEKVVKPGYYIYEFYDEKDKKRYPGFQTDKHPDGYCLPCCFTKYNTLERVKAKNKCINENIKNPEEQKKEEIEEKDEKQDEYIKGPDKFPLLPGKWGYLPVGIQKMLHEVNADCQISKTNTNVKKNHPCLLRHGIEVNQKQSFVACISDILFFAQREIDETGKLTKKMSKVLSIKEMKEQIIKSLKIDNFIKYQNGNLVSDFYENREVDMNRINKYRRSTLFSKLNMEKPEDKFYFSKVVSSFENFIFYLRDDNSIIDHTYLWDLVSIPNKFLFQEGINLVIFQLPNDDITNNVQLLCPTNHYSTQFYNPRKKTVIIMKEDGYYEPIYSYTISETKLTIDKTFKEYDVHISKAMKSVLQDIIKPFFKRVCSPLGSMPNVYKAKRSLLLHELIEKLDKYNYEIEKQVVNFNNKVIGVVAKEPDPSARKGFIPCYPSSICHPYSMDESCYPSYAKNNNVNEWDYVFMTDLSLWTTYENTFSFLNKLYKTSKKRKETADIPCNPAFKIVEDEMVVGILTETNQFIQLSQPITEMEIKTAQNIPSIRNSNYIVNSKSKNLVSVDIPTTTSTDVDEERVDYIKRIKLETSFYNVFRNTIRILLNDYENIKIREKIEDEIKKEFIIYSEKLKNVDKLLKDLASEKIQFTGDENYYKLITEVSTCLVKDKEKCSDTTNLCVFVNEKGSCNLILPQKNLTTGKENETIYYGKMADEIIRYSRINSFIFKPQTFLSFNNINYNLKEDEIILIQSLLTQEYFESLVPASVNKYVKHISYDEAEPQISQMYENVFAQEDIKENPLLTLCKVSVKKSISTSFWKKCFPENYKEIEYGNTHVCTFNFIINIIEEKIGEKLTISKIKNELYDSYKTYLEKYVDQITDILIIEGKKKLGEQVKAGTLSFSDFIYNENYFLTTFDLWLLVQKYKIPTIFLSKTPILEANREKNIFVGFGEQREEFAFIIIPAVRAESIPKFKIIIDKDKKMFSSLDKLEEEECDDVFHDAFLYKTSIEEFLSGFMKPKKSYPKKLKYAHELENDEENEEESEKIVVIKKKKPKFPLLTLPPQPQIKEQIKEGIPTPATPKPLENPTTPTPTPTPTPTSEKPKKKTRKPVLKLRGQQKTKKVRIIDNSSP